MSIYFSEQDSQRFAANERKSAKETRKIKYILVMICANVYSDKEMQRSIYYINNIIYFYYILWIYTITIDIYVIVASHILYIAYTYTV